MVKTRTILFYNAIPMPHSILLQEKLVDAGYMAYFWYYKDLTSLYPWNKLDRKYSYYIFSPRPKLFLKLLRNLFSSDLVIITGWHTYMHILLFILSKILFKKVAIQMDVPEKFSKGFPRYIKKGLLVFSDRIFLSGVSGAQLITSKWGIRKMKIADFPYLHSPFNFEDQVNVNLLNKFNIETTGKIKVLISNRFEERKGYSLLLEVFRKLESSNLKQFQFTILGSGPQFEKYKMEFGKFSLKIDLLGWVSFEKYLEEVSHTDILLHPSIHEPYGIPPMDCLLRGKLVIVSDGVYSTKDKVINNQTGFVYDRNSALELFNIFNYVASNNSRVYEIGVNAMNKFRSYDENINISAIKDLIN